MKHVDGAAHMIRLEAWKQIGGYNEIFPGWGCDLDACLRLRQAGWALAVDDREIISHDWENGTVNTDSELRKVYQDGWAQRLVDLHGTDRIPGLGGWYG